MNEKEKVIKALKEYNELATGRLASIIGLNYYKLLPILQKMWEEKLIVGNVQPRSTTWRLN